MTALPLGHPITRGLALSTIAVYERLADGDATLRALWEAGAACDGAPPSAAYRACATAHKAAVMALVGAAHPACGAVRQLTGRPPCPPCLRIAVALTASMLVCALLTRDTPTVRAAGTNLALCQMDLDRAEDLIGRELVRRGHAGATTTTTAKGEDR